MGAVTTNPLALVTGMIFMAILGLGSYDLFTEKTLLYRGFMNTEKFIRKPFIAVLLSLIILCNWYWNIKKGL